MLDGISSKKQKRFVSGVIGAGAQINSAYAVGDEKLMSPRQRREQRRRYYYRQYQAQQRRSAKIGGGFGIDAIQMQVLVDDKQVDDIAQIPDREDILSEKFTEPKIVATASAFRMSFVGAMVFGMVATTVVYQSLGQWARASEQSAAPIHTSNAVIELTQEEIAREEVARVAAQLAQKNAAVKAEKQRIKEEVEASKSVEQKEFEVKARKMVAGYPIEKMLPEIFKQDRQVAIWLIAMAKQESQWGKRVPVLNGQDCLNYWGFRAKRARMGTGGHTCFDSVEDAIKTVGKRLSDLHYKYKRRTPERMIVWKCGYSCAGHSDAGVKSWIRTVGMYRNKLL